MRKIGENSFLSSSGQFREWIFLTDNRATFIAHDVCEPHVERNPHDPEGGFTWDCDSGPRLEAGMVFPYVYQQGSFRIKSIGDVLERGTSTTSKRYYIEMSIEEC